MPSATAQTEYRRKLRRKNAGRKARNARTNNGSTPKFPLHTAQAVANAKEKDEAGKAEG
jgi:hypothetical protein